MRHRWLQERVKIGTAFQIGLVEGKPVEGGSPAGV
jgi:hypothetical protein